MRGRFIPYSADELAFVKALSSLPRHWMYAEFLEVFGRTDVSFENLRSLSKRMGWLARPRTPWSEHELALLREHFADKPTKDLAAMLGRRIGGVYQMAYKLGLKKSEAYLASEAAGRLQPGDTRGAATRFQKGQTPANKGIAHRKGWAPGRMREGQFKPGSQPHTWVPVGSTRVVGGYEYTKVQDRRKVRPSANWKATHILRWEAINGPIPKGHALKSIDGNRLNTDPSNWVLIDRAILPTLNGGSGKRISYDEAPPELKPTIMTLAKIKNAVGKQQRRKAQAA